MKLKAFLASYILFIGILFTALGTVSAFMTNSQLALLREKSTREYRSLAATLGRDMAVIYQRSDHFHEDLNSLMSGYIRYYSQHHIQLTISELADLTIATSDIELSFSEENQEHFMTLIGALPRPFQTFQLYYEVNITETMTELKQIQSMLLILTIFFSIIAAFALYFILSRIFKPLEIVAVGSRKIADGQYQERIHIQGENELSAVALDFNRMAAQVENQIQMLEDEAMAKQQFVDNFAHEIRTPLTAILGYAEYIQKAPITEKSLIELMQYIINEASHMQKLGDLLLELAMLRQYAPAVKTTISVPKLFLEVSQTLANHLEEKKVQLILQHDIDDLEGQEDLIKSLLLNLVSNALKACEAKIGMIYLRGSKLESGIMLTVQDNGCGIPSSELSKVVEPFFRVDKARNRKDGGTGLGLSLCKQIVQAHQGEMFIESRLGEGTKIKIIFKAPNTSLTII